MFCPNCGNDCVNAKFCIKCGTKVDQEVKEAPEWSGGSPCPHCGGTKLDGKNCAFCGAQLLASIGENPPRSRTKPVSISQVNLRSYYTEYYPNRPAAIKALRRDTQISLKEAKATIDRVFESCGDTTPVKESIKFAMQSLWKKHNNI